MSVITKVLISLSSFLLFFSNKSYCNVYKDESVYMYNGIPGCSCFNHCGCFSHFIGHEGGFPDDKIGHPRLASDRVWHEFMKKILTTLKTTSFFLSSCYQRTCIESLVKCPPQNHYPFLLSDYMYVTENLGNLIEKERIENIKWYKKIYSKPKEQELLTNHINRVNKQTDDAIQLLGTIPETIIPLFQNIIENCDHNGSYNMAKIYNKGLISYLHGNLEESLDEIHQLLELAEKNNKQNFLASEVLQRQGENLLDVGRYHEAIEALTKAISKNPNNFEAYLQRASAYFETGDFDSSLNDYSTYKNSDHFSHYSLPPNEFIDAFSEAAFQGAYDASCDFIPSLCSTAYGLGECLWAFGEKPITCLENLAGAGYDMSEHVIDFLKNVDRNTLDKCTNEIVTLYDGFTNLSAAEKGELMGYTLGRYGVDIFAGAATVKGFSAYKKLREANRLCNLEAMSMSVTNKEIIVSRCLQQYSERCKFFENSKIHWGQQNKHILGNNNYIETKSIFEHKDASSLLKKYAGTGTPKRGEMGKAGYQEIIDFKERIGIWISDDGIYSLPTTKGVIHYGNKGAHIVPVHPDKKVW